MSEHPQLLTNITDNLASWPWILPELLLTLTLVSILGLVLLPSLHQRTWTRPLAIVGILLASYNKYHLAAQLMYTSAFHLFNSLLILDSLALFFCWLILGLGLLVLLTAPPWLATAPGPMALILSILLAGCILVMANHWLILYLGLTLISLATASLMAIAPTPSSQVASLHYMLYSMAMGALMLWGIGYYYGLTNTLSLSPATERIWTIWPQVIMLIIYLCSISALLFNLAVAPFHFWAPDIYAKLPAALTAYLSTVPKLAALGGLLRLSQSFLAYPLCELVVPVKYGLGSLALLTMLIGHLGAVKYATDWRRVLAYGGIAQGGLLMAGIAALPYCQTGLLYYSAVYGIMNWAAWQGLHMLEETAVKTPHFAGLGRKLPVLGISVTIILIALVGLPPTAGFTGKLLIWTGLWEQQCHTGGLLFATLLGVSMLGTVLALYYYLQLAYELFIAPNQPKQQDYLPNQYTTIILALVAVLLLLGFFVQ